MTKVVVADADALVALLLEGDPLHDEAVNISRMLVKQGSIIVYPVTVFPETITFLKRSLNQSEKAHFLNRQLQQGIFQVEYIEADVMKRASQIFDTAISKQNTFFDAIVAATAEELEVDAIFSFDNWYTKLGFKLASSASST